MTNKPMIISDMYNNLSVVPINNLNLKWPPSSFSTPNYITYTSYPNFDESVYKNTGENPIFVTCTATGSLMSDRMAFNNPPNTYSPPSTWNIYVYSDPSPKPTTLVSQGFAYYSDSTPYINTCTVSFIVMPLNYYIIKSTLNYQFTGTSSGNGIVSSSFSIKEFS